MENTSIIIPFYNEAENVTAVLTEVSHVCPDAEIIAVDDGSTDRTRALIAAFPGATLVALPRNLGQSAALYAGLLRARGDICVMLDGDGQNDPADIPALVAALAHADVACGYRRQRRDHWRRRVASRVANRIRRAVLQDGIRDTGCSLKAMRRAHLGALIPFNGMHRFLPALWRRAGLSLIEVPVNHRPRLRGVSKYTIGGRAIRGLRDLLGMRWLLSRQVVLPAGVFVTAPGANVNSAVAAPTEIPAAVAVPHGRLAAAGQPA